MGQRWGGGLTHFPFSQQFVATRHIMEGIGRFGKVSAEIVTVFANSSRLCMELHEIATDCKELHETAWNYFRLNSRSCYNK